MKYDKIWQVRSQLNGCYMPDNFALFGSKRAAIAYAREIARESSEHIRDNAGDRVYFFVREDWQEISKYHDSWPYIHVVEPVSWREIAREIGLSTREAVLSYEYQL